MKSSAKKIVNSTPSNKSTIRSETYVVKSSTSTQVQLPPSQNYLLRQAKSRALRAPFISKPDPNKIRLPCIDNHLAPDGSRMNVAAAPIEMRMAIRLNQVDQFKKKAKKPPGALPPIGFSTWDNWPLDAKVPDFRDQSWPPGSLYFTRGKLCQSLNFPRQAFDLSDPKGYKKSSQLKDYTALHDPHAIRYFQQKPVLSLLQENNLINEKNDVICNAKEYNKFRAYISTIQNEGVNESLAKSDARLQFQMNLRRPFHQYIEQQKNGNKAIDRHNDAVKTIEENANLKLEKAKDLQEDWECQMEAFALYKREMRFQQIQEFPETDFISMYRRKKVKDDQTDERRRLLGKSVYEMKQAAYNSKYDKLILKSLKDRLNIDKIIKLKTRDEQALELKEVIDETVRIKKDKWRKRYDKQIEFAHRNHVAIEAAKKSRANEELRIERKYFDLWRAFVKKRKDLRDDSGHCTAFRIERDMRTLVAELEEQSGYNPKKNFLMQILEFGRQEQQKHEAENQAHKKTKGKNPKKPKHIFKEKDEDGSDDKEDVN